MCSRNRSFPEWWIDDQYHYRGTHSSDKYEGDVAYGTVLYAMSIPYCQSTQMSVCDMLTKYHGNE